jgi:hypothetical protein
VRIDAAAECRLRDGSGNNALIGSGRFLMSVAGVNPFCVMCLSATTCRYFSIRRRSSNGGREAIEKRGRGREGEETRRINGDAALNEMELDMRRGLGGHWVRRRVLSPSLACWWCWLEVAGIDGRRAWPGGLVLGGELR